MFPWLGKRPIAEIEVAELLAVVRRIEDRGAIDSAHRVLQHVSSIYRYAIASGKAKYNPAPDLKDALSKRLKGQFATIIEPKKVGILLRAIDVYEGEIVTRTALALAPMLFCRPGELRGMEWSELNFEKPEWRLPPMRQKLRKNAKNSVLTGDHVVPLATQAVALLKAIQPLTGKSKFVFPSERSWSRSMSNGTINAALRRLGFGKDEITGHGFRHMASTLLNEQGWNEDAIECQLSHGDDDYVRGIYNKAKYLPERREMMQSWADYLDKLKASK